MFMASAGVTCNILEKVLASVVARAGQQLFPSPLLAKPLLSFPIQTDPGSLKEGKPGSFSTSLKI